MAGPSVGYMGTDEPEPRFQSKPARRNFRGSPEMSLPPRSQGQQGSEDTRAIPAEVMPPSEMDYEATGDMVTDRGAEAGIDPADPAFISSLRARYPDDPELQQALDYIEGLSAAEAGSDPALLGGNSPMAPPEY